MKTNKVVTRFAPSPTGLLHVGNYRTALFSYLFALQNEGKFILRIEDTDRARYKKEFEDNIIESLEWLGFKNDEFYRQSDRAEIHKSYIEKMIKSGHAYISKETPKEKGDRDEVIRFRNPNKKVKFNDLIRGDIEFDTTDLGDFIIAKSLTEPVFHLVVVVDDFEMGITHVLRGDDHISNTPRHILIQEAISAPTPIYAHLPLVLDVDRSKLSKRKGALAITEYRDQGFLPETIINFMALLGWNPGTDQEIMSMAELVEKFDLSKVQKSGAIFNTEKLLWMNKEYLKKMPAAKLEKEISDVLDTKYIYPKELLSKISPIILERISTIGELKNYVEAGEFDYFFEAPEPVKEILIWKKDTDFTIPKNNLQKVSEFLNNLSDSDFIEISLKEKLMPLAETSGKGSVLWPLRVALSGKEKSPDPFTLLYILGKEESLKRIQKAILVL